MIRAKIITGGEFIKLELEPETDGDKRALENLVRITIPLARDAENGRLAKIHYMAEESNRLKRVFLVT